MTRNNGDWGDQTIFRRVKDRDNPYVMIDRECFEVETLSWKAKGLLGYLLSRPNDWTVIMADLVKRSSDGEHAVRSAVHELEAHGYMVRSRVRDKKTGMFGPVTIEVHEVPVPEECRTYDLGRSRIVAEEKSPVGGFPQVGEPQVENHALLSTDSTKEGSTNIPPAADSSASVAEIEIDSEYPDADTIECKACGDRQKWPTSDADRRKAENLTCHRCGAMFIVHGFKASGGAHYTWKHPDLRKQERQGVNYPCVVAFCHLAGMNYGKLSQLIKAQWDKKIQEVAGDKTQQEIVEAIDSLTPISGLENPHMYRFQNALTMALNGEVSERYKLQAMRTYETKTGEDKPLLVRIPSFEELLAMPDGRNGP